MTLKDKLENLYKALIEKHGLTMYGEDLDGSIFRLTEIFERVTDYEGNVTEKGPTKLVVSFNDEYMGYVLSGNVAGRVGKEMDEELAKLGFRIYDGDGEIAYMERLKEAPCPC